jgi:hypothetical protein
MWSWSGFALSQVRAAMRPAPTGFVAMLLSLVLASPQGAAAEALPVDLELALAVDVSRSVDEEEARLQREGYIAAFRHPNVVEAIRRGPLGRIAVSYYEWGGYGNTHLVVDWTLVGDRESAATFAGALARTEPMLARRTGVSGAIDYGAALFDRNRFDGRRRVIDISGDGANNSGELVTVARDRAVAAGITINGLPILNGRESPGGWRQIDTLDLYYRDCVIGGPGAFYIVARDFPDFARAVLRKLVLEIAGMQPSGLAPARATNPILRRAAADARTPPPCDIGERRRRQRWFGDDVVPQPHR